MIWRELLISFSPLWTLTGAILLALGTSIVITDPARERRWYRLLSAVSLFLALILAARLWRSQPSLAVSILYTDRFSLFLSMLVLFSSLATVAVAPAFLGARPSLNKSEFYLLILFGALGMLMMTSSANLLFVFLGLELASLAFYIAIGMREESKAAHEASLKYFLLGALASALFLYGIAFYYAATGEISLAGLTGNSLSRSDLIALRFAFVFLCAGLAFKLALFPFYFWTPDVYQGAPTLLVGWMSSALKAAVFGFLVMLFKRASPWLGDLSTVLQILAGVSIAVGACLALGQHSLKRLLAASSISHAGFALLAVAVSAADGWKSEGTATLLFYLLVYTLATMGTFILLSLFRTGDDDMSDDLSITDLRGLSRHSPETALYLSLFLLSLAGLPPTAGFMSKYAVLLLAMGKSFYFLSAIAVVASLISLGYYLRIIAAIYFEEGASRLKMSAIQKTLAIFVVTFFGVAVVVLGLLPDAYLQWALGSQ